jgi:hypothetical protein
MGLTFTKLFQRLFSKKEMRILMVRQNKTKKMGGAGEELLRVKPTSRRRAGASASRVGL